jgi:CDP-4-dehydro-6-deoxyglucose reductase, E1
MSQFNHALMSNNISREDLGEVIKFLQQDTIPQLTNGPKVREFEEAWSKWLGVKHSLFVNSGSSANQLTMLAIRYFLDLNNEQEAEIIVPPLTWVSDISAVLQNRLKPVFVDINLKNLSFDLEKLKNAVTPKTRAVFITHVLGLNGLTQELIDFCNEKKIPIIEDVCESHGATFNGQKLGSIGFASNFSFYFAHHMSTIEGGMICTNNEGFYEYLRAFRSHGMAREMTNHNLKQAIIQNNPTLNRDFIFLAPAYNFRSTEINAVLGLSQLPRLDSNNSKRADNFKYFLSNLDSNKYITDFDIDGQSSYAFIVVLKNPYIELRNKVEKTLSENGIEFRRGLSGGGSQLKQPYLKNIVSINESDFPNIEHVHHFGWYIGNYPDLEREKIDMLVEVLNKI